MNTRTQLFLYSTKNDDFYKNSSVRERTNTHICARIGFSVSLVSDGKDSDVREKYIEQRLRREVISRGGLCEKWNSGTAGWPDRIVMFPNRKMAFVEVKAPNEVPRKLQLYRHEQLRQLGFPVYVLDKPEQIGGILDEIENQM